MRRKAFAARVWSKLVAFRKKERLLEKGDRVLAAVSGGPDSVCLAHYLAQERRRVGFTLFLLHVHHGLRGEAADRDEAFVRELGLSLGVPVESVRADAAALARERGGGLEDAGRKLRYDALAAAARRLVCNKAATGHQMDDQAETVLLNLLRGSKALAGIPARRPLAPGVEVIRPLLPLSRAEVLEYLTVHGLRHRADRSNADLAFTRNWVRRKLLPLLETKNPRIRERLAGLAEKKAHGAELWPRRVARWRQI